MIEITEKSLKDATKNLMFELDESEYQILINDFIKIKKQIEVFDRLEGIEEVTPMTFPFECFYGELREDEVNETLSQEEVLANAHNVKDGQIKIPKVIK